MRIFCSTNRVLFYTFRENYRTNIMHNARHDSACPFISANCKVKYRLNESVSSFARGGRGERRAEENTSSPPSAACNYRICINNDSIRLSASICGVVMDFRPTGLFQQVVLVLSEHRWKKGWAWRNER